MDRRAVWVMAVAPFVVLAAVLRQLPGYHGASAPTPWWEAVTHASVLAGLMAAHATCYALWTPHAPNRMLVNEFVTRIWFVLFGLVVVAPAGDTGPLYMLMAAAWGVASWCTHYLLLRSQGGYRALENLAQMGLFLLGLALVALLSVRIALPL